MKDQFPFVAWHVYYVGLGALLITMLKHQFKWAAAAYLNIVIGGLTMFALLASLGDLRAGVDVVAQDWWSSVDFESRIAIVAAILLYYSAYYGWFLLYTLIHRRAFNDGYEQARRELQQPTAEVLRMPSNEKEARRGNSG